MPVAPQKPTWTLVMEMLARLHELGYQRLRLSAGAAPTGLHWRYGIASVEHFQANGYLLQRTHYPGVAHGSSSGSYAPFLWDGGQALDADGLARKFLESFPEVATSGRGSDQEYARWFAEAAALCQPSGAIVMYGEYEDAEAAGRFDITNGKRVGLPPPRSA